MEILIVIDSWKGSLSSREANEAARCGVLDAIPDAIVRCQSVSDGGEGFLEAVEETGEYESVSVEVADPLMRPVRARFLMRGQQAVIEMAQASGLGLLRPEERDPLRASSYGTGQLLAEAIRRGATDILVGLGGSATSDCGKGALQALGPLRPHFLTLATDVAAPLLGPCGAATVFARQKAAPGLSDAAVRAMLEELEARAEEFVRRSASLHGYDRSAEPGAGAAGGLGYAFMQYFGARRISGADFILRNITPGNAALLITGEGCADSQTLMGKLPYAILQRAKVRKLPVILLAGQVHDRSALLEAGFSQVLAVNPPDSPLEECLRPDIAADRIRQTVARALRTFRRPTQHKV